MPSVPPTPPLLLLAVLAAMLTTCTGAHIPEPPRLLAGAPRAPRAPSGPSPSTSTPSSAPQGGQKSTAVLIPQAIAPIGAAAPTPTRSPSSSTAPPATETGDSFNASFGGSLEEHKQSPARPPSCVHIGEEECPPAGELCRCKLLPGTTAVVCCDLDKQVRLKESLSCHDLGRANITALHVRNLTVHSLDVSVFNLTSQLTSLAITDGHITELNGELDVKNLVCLNLSANSLINVLENTFTSPYSLTNLDLSGNDLQQIFNIDADVPEFKLDISGNNKLSCVSIMELMKKMRNLHFSHNNNTYCLMPGSFQWFNTTEKIPLSSVVLLNKLEEECPPGETEPCSCDTFRLDMVAGKSPTFSVKVDCSNRRLIKLPETLPKNTIFLNVSSNNISNLEALSMNAAYRDIRMFYADDNQVTSITALEGSTFINSFQTLSLRNNNISSLPTYILSNVFDRNYWDARTVHLGLNRLKCDCSTAQTIKMWLNANYKHIPDYNEVLCENMRERVFELDQNKVCTVQSDWTEYVYYLVAAEVILLILLISKVSYDYWVFKTAGYLPWPASKMPKLPCDWVFES